MYIAKSGRQVVAVDPLNTDIRRIQKTITLNQIETCILLQNAIGDNREDLNISVRPRNVGGSSLESTLIKANGVLETTSTILMDDLLEVIPFKEAIMKIDIEGSEAKAFCHSDRLFEEVYVHAIFMEWKHTNRIAKKSDENFAQFYIMLGTLLKHGFKPYRLQDGSYYSLKIANQLHWPVNIVWLRQ